MTTTDGRFRVPLPMEPETAPEWRVKNDAAHFGKNKSRYRGTIVAKP